MLFSAGCVEAATESTTIELTLAGADASAPFEGRDGAMITLERADVAFGPLYLCAGYTAGELCEEALAEWRDATVIDALDPTPTAPVAMNALTGTAHSYMYDLGIVSLLTEDAPLVTPAAESLGPASAVVEGRVAIDGQTIPFTVAVRVEQTETASRGTSVVRSGESESFDHAIEPEGRTALLVRIDPRPWLATASFRGLLEDATCAPGADLVCSGAIEQRCAEDGTVAETRDCASLGQPCLRGLGCVDHVELDPEGQIGRALRTGLSAGTRPTFEVSYR
ncbi:MAG: hypothetical protein R3B82_29280 [Sandaracinaceae bacterium]